MIPLCKPWIDEQDLIAVQQPLMTGWVTQGPQVSAFEDEFAAFVGAAHAVAVSSGTAALHLALEAVGVGHGDEVVTVSHSFIATANVVRFCGATPVFVDIDPGTLNMDPSLLRAALTEKTRAILVVHQLGMPCALDALCAIAAEHGVAVVEDAACAIGSEYFSDGTWQRVGRPAGSVATFSFHPRKILTTGDGGMITSNDPAIDDFVRKRRNHGMVRTPGQPTSFPSIGYNYRLSDIHAAVGRTQLAKLDMMLERRRAQAARYDQAVSTLNALRIMARPEYARSNFQSYALRAANPAAQSALLAHLASSGIAAQRGVMCAHLEEVYATDPSIWRQSGSLRHSEEAMNECVLLPIYHALSDEEQGQVIEALQRFDASC